MPLGYVLGARSLIEILSIQIWVLCGETRFIP